MLADSSPTTMSVHTPLTVKKSPTPPPLNFDWSYLFNVWTTLTPHLSSKTGQLSKRTFCSFLTITTRINTLNIHYTTSKQKPPTTCFNISPTFAPLSSNWLAEEKSPLIMSFCKKFAPRNKDNPQKYNGNVSYLKYPISQLLVIKLCYQKTWSPRQTTPRNALTLPSNPAPFGKSKEELVTPVPTNKPSKIIEFSEFSTKKTNILFGNNGPPLNSRKEQHLHLGLFPLCGGKHTVEECQKSQAKQDKTSWSKTFSCNFTASQSFLVCWYPR